MPRAGNSKSFAFLHKETKTDSLIQTRQKWSHICQKLSALVTVQQDYMHITLDNKEFQPALIRLNSTTLYWS